MNSLVRTLIFCFLFATGFGAMSLALLAKEFDVYYNNKQYKEYVDYQIKALQEQRVVYNDKLTLLYGDPEIKLRLGRAVLGAEPQREDTYFPKPDNELKQQSLSIVKEIMGGDFILTPKPQWVITINKQQNNDVLLYGGIAVVLLSMFFFVDAKKTEADADGKDDEQAIEKD